MKIWKAHYTDEHHDLDIDILNTNGDYSSNPLSFSINGVKFTGTSIGDFELADPEQYERANKEFNFFKYDLLSAEKNTYYNLQRYSLDVKIPINVIRKSDSSLIEGILRICFKYVEHDIQKNQSVFYCDNERVYHDDISVSEITLYVDDKQYSHDDKSLYFENILTQLHKMVKDEYFLKCCFMCQWSDYSPYGNDDFGTMLCYKNHKEEYLKVHDKDSFFKYVFPLDFDSMQETYLCDEFAQRTQCEGYRGFVK